MKKYLAILGVLILIVVALSLMTGGTAGGGFAALPTGAQLEKQSMLSAEEAFHDFGTISMQDGVVTKVYTVMNNSSEDVRVDSVVTSCMCTTAYVLDGERREGPYGMPGHGLTVPRANEVIGAGESRQIEVVFDPAAHGPLGVGEADRSVYLVDEKGSALELRFTARVTN